MNEKNRKMIEWFLEYLKNHKYLMIRKCAKEFRETYLYNTEYKGKGKDVGVAFASLIGTLKKAGYRTDADKCGARTYEITDGMIDGVDEFLYSGRLECVKKQKWRDLNNVDVEIMKYKDYMVPILYFLPQDIPISDHFRTLYEQVVF